MAEPVDAGEREPESSTSERNEGSPTAEVQPSDAGVRQRRRASSSSSAAMSLTTVTPDRTVATTQVTAAPTNSLRLAIQPGGRDYGMLRAIRRRDMLASFGRLWRYKPCQVKSEKEVERETQLFLLSRPVAELKEFMSHSWSTPGWKKFVSLCLVYNGVAATLMGIVGAALGILFGKGFERSASSDDGAPESSDSHYNPWSFILGVLFFTVTFLFKEQVIGCRRKPGVFLDRVCIDQRDSASKLAGIRSIGGYLLNTKSMLILYSPEYFTRLWCVFELAVFFWAIEAHCLAKRSNLLRSVGIGAHPLLPFRVLPLNLCVSYLVKIVLWATVLEGIELLRWLISSYLHVFFVVRSLCILSLASLLFLLTTVEMKERLTLESQIAAFSVHEARCFDPVDRALIFEWIDTAFHDPEDARGGLDQFDAFVHESFPALIGDACGPPILIPVTLYLLFTIPTSLSYLDHIISALRSGNHSVIPQSVVALLATHPVVLYTIQIFARHAYVVSALKEVSDRSLCVKFLLMCGCSVAVLSEEWFLMLLSMSTHGLISVVVVSCLGYLALILRIAFLQVRVRKAGVRRRTYLKRVRRERADNAASSSLGGVDQMPSSPFRYTLSDS